MFQLELELSLRKNFRQSEQKNLNWQILQQLLAEKEKNEKLNRIVKELEQEKANNAPLMERAQRIEGSR